MIPRERVMWKFPKNSQMYLTWMILILVKDFVFNSILVKLHIFEQWFKKKLNKWQLYQFRKKKPNPVLILQLFMLSTYENSLGIFTWPVLVESC